MEKNIYDVIMENDEESPELKIEGDFTFESSKHLPNEELLKLHNQTIRFEGGFIHFERVYSLNNGVMLRISMGSFDRPEHLYLIITDNRLSYYPELPLRSPINLEAHKHLTKAVNG